MKIRETNGVKAFRVVNALLLILLCFITLYPFLYVVFASLSHPNALLMHEGMLLYPLRPTLKAYELAFRDNRIPIGYMNTLLYVGGGTLLSLLTSTLGAYVLSRPNLMLRKVLTLLCMFTMYFSGGMVPDYLLLKDLHMLNTRWAIILPGMISTWNMMIMITAFRGIPESLVESARIDGASEVRTLFQIMVPLMLSTLMVMVLYYGVGYWNSWFSAKIYLTDRTKFPLQLFLREILIDNQISEMTAGATIDVEDIGTTLKYATIIVSTLPILCIYPFIQRYFVKGVMIGSVKG